MATILSIGAGAVEGSAQAPEAGIDQSAATRPWWLLWSRTSRQDRVLWAMWTLHVHQVNEGLSNDGLVGVMLGFRAGLLYGYDERLGWIAGKVPIIPLLQPVVYGRLGPVTADLTYTWVVVSLTAGLRF